VIRIYKQTLLLLGVFGSLLCVSLAHADIYQPSFLELKQIDQTLYHVLWKVPARNKSQRMSLHVRFVKDVEVVHPVHAGFIGNAYVERFTIRRQGGLEGTRIEIDGLKAMTADVLVRIHRLSGSTQVISLNSAKTAFIVSGDPTRWDVAKNYVTLGIEHIWGGSDHLLFVTCLIFIAGSWRRILVTITGFTVAHSITLSLAALNLIHVPVPPVEASIALSIVFLAREIAVNRRNTISWRYPIAVSGSFGLLHGLGFASALKEVGLPSTEIPAALLSFNIGIETGQIIFVAVVVSLLALIKSILVRFHRPGYGLINIEMPVAYIVGGVSTYWLLDRIAAF